MTCNKLAQTLVFFKLTLISFCKNELSFATRQFYKVHSQILKEQKPVVLVVGSGFGSDAVNGTGESGFGE